MEIIEVKISELKLYEKNARLHPRNQIELLKKNILKFGFTTPILISDDKEVIAGHGRLIALKELGKEIVPVVKIEGLSKNEIKSLRLADNKLAELAQWDMNLVIEELKGLDTNLVDLTGFDRDLLISPDEKDDKLPQNPPQRTKRGEIWGLGEHKVIVGSSLEIDTFNRLFEGVKAKLVFTSPPYNMDNRSYYKNYKDNLESQKYIDFNLKVIKNVEDFVKGFLFWNISYNKNSRWEWIKIFNRILEETKFRFLENIVWDKGHGMPITQNNALTRRYEMILATGDEGEIKREITYSFVGDNDKQAIFNKKTQQRLSNYWYIDTFRTQTEFNKACFPVALPLKAILIMSKPKDIILDPFIGTGTTLIACEKSNRICFGVEQDPLMVDVIIKRYEDYETGNKAIKIA